MRLFIAINFSDETRARLIALRDELRARSTRGNFSLPQNLHLTLAFLGECDARQTAAVKSAMDVVEFTSLTLTVERIGNFRGDLWWAGLKSTPRLSALHRELSDALRKNGFMLEKYGFNPHITLGREVVTEVQPWNIEPFGETVDKLKLMKSERINGKLTYTPIYHVKK